MTKNLNQLVARGLFMNPVAQVLVFIWFAVVALSVFSRWTNTSTGMSADYMVRALSSRTCLYILELVMLAGTYTTATMLGKEFSTRRHLAFITYLHGLLCTHALLAMDQGFPI
jgi:hypothetical protein